MQDSFAFATGVAAVITAPDGQPITRPSNFSRLCSGVIRTTEKGLRNCMRSDALLGVPNPRGPNIQPCLSCGLWDAGASIFAGERHIANWLIGQVRNETQDEETIVAYARDIGADEATFRAAFANVTVMSQEQFKHVCDFLFLMANQLSELAYTNLVQQRSNAIQRQFEQLQHELQEKAHQSQKLEALGQLAGGVAHDFNNLLTALLGNASLLEISLRERNAEVDLELLGEITNAAARATRLTRQLMTFSRQQPLHVEEVDVAQQLREIQPMLRRLLPESVQLRANIASGTHYVSADPTQIDQIVVNLAVNARDAMLKGGLLELSLSTVVVDELLTSMHPGLTLGPHVLLGVRDNGVGMPQEVVEHIFEPFYSTKPQHRGPGLGLSTVYGIVRQLNGGVTVRSTVGLGTHFGVYLPLLESRTHAVTAVSSPPVRGGTETVLLCEDDNALRILTARLLREAGYTVVVAESAELALEQFDAHGGTFGVLLTDVILPGISGRALADELRKRAPNLRTLFVSGYTADVFTDASASARDLNLLEKPFTRETLLRRLRELLDGETA